MKDSPVCYQIKEAYHGPELNQTSLALYRGTVPVLCIVGPRVSLQYMGLAMYKPMFEKLEGKILPAHSSAGLAGVSALIR